MKLPVIDEIRKESLPDAPAWIDPVLIAINKFFRFIYRALNNNLTIEDNLNFQKEVLTLTQNDIDIGYEIKCKIKGKPSACMCGQIVTADEGSHTAVSGGYVDWLYVNGFIKIYNIPGLSGTTKYKVTLIIF